MTLSRLQAVLDRYGGAVLLTLLTVGLFITHVLLQAAAALFIAGGLVALARGRSWRPTLLDGVLMAYALSGLIAFWVSGLPPARIGAAMLHHIVLLSWIPLRAWLETGREDAHGLSLDRWGNAVVVLAVVVSAAGVWRHVVEGLERTSGFFGGYFTLASLLVWSLPLTAGLYLSRSRGAGRWYVPALLLQFFALWWTLTRSAFLGWMVAVGVWLIMHLWRTRGARRPLIGLLRERWAVVILMPLLLVILVAGSRDPRINPLRNAAPAVEAPARSVDLSSGRGEIIADAGRLLGAARDGGQWRAILLGFGLDSRNRLVESDFTSWESDYLQALMNQGVVGLLLILALWGSLLRTVWQGLRSGDPRLMGLAAGGLALFLMSPLTLKMTSWHSAGMILLTASWIRAGLAAVGDR